MSIQKDSTVKVRGTSKTGKVLSIYPKRDRVIRASTSLLVKVDHGDHKMTYLIEELQLVV